MIYLKRFEFPDEDAEVDFLIEIQRSCYDSFYPFKVLSANGFKTIEFEPITILYGGNGSGKTTALNVIADKIKIKRDAVYNKSNFYPDYVNMCSFLSLVNIPNKSRIITSDDVFDYMLSVRNINEGIDFKRDNLFAEHSEYTNPRGEYAGYQLKNLEDYDKFKRINETKRKTQSKFVRSNLKDNIREYSNGENAYRYFIEKIEENALYILDEPENSLSPKRQIEVANFIKDSARFYNCQFIISTHSPFFLAMEGAKIYDLDEYPVAVKQWTKLENVLTYHDFFKSHSGEF